VGPRKAGRASPSAGPRSGPPPRGPRRTRVRITGTYFELPDRPGSPSGSASRIMISLAKRLVPSAVRRNTVKRIVREAGRAATHVNDDRTYLVRLRQYPGGRRPKGGARAGPRPDAAKAGAEPAPAMGLTAIKRELRADA